MGNILARSPNTDKKIEDYSSSQLRYGSCEMQGWRKTMEDSIIALPFYEKNASLFGIFDGHGGILSLYSYKQHNYEQALKETFLKMDEYLRMPKVNQLLSEVAQPKHRPSVDNEALRSLPSSPVKQRNSKPVILTYNHKTLELTHSASHTHQRREASLNERHLIANEMGTTANVLLILGSTLYLANVGDSVSVKYKNGKAVRLNREHKTSLQSEYNRITKSGRQVINNRVEGKLNLTRAIGDLQFKSSPKLNVYEQSVTAFPEVTKVKNINDIEFIIMGCDGIWDCVDPQKLCDSVAKITRTHPTIPLSSVISNVFDQILSKANHFPIGSDNMSCIIIQLFNKESKTL